MKRYTTFIVLTIIFGLIAFMLTPIQWVNGSLAAGTPPANLLPFFMLVTGFEALGFGVGMTFLLLSWDKGAGRRAAFFSVVWLLISWWPHDNLHRAISDTDFGSLLAIEIAFHSTLVVAGFILARYFTTTKNA